MKIVFVCSGNICRSPMAAEYFRHRAASQGLTGWEVCSAGTLGIHGSRASAEAVEAMAELGVDLSRHRSRGLSSEVLEGAALTICMEQDHLEFLARRYPDGQDVRLLLRAFETGSSPSANPRDLEDPIGHDLEFYREQIPLLVRCVDHLIVHVRNLK